MPEDEPNAPKREGRSWVTRVSDPQRAAERSRQHARWAIPCAVLSPLGMVLLVLAHLLPGTVAVAAGLVGGGGVLVIGLPRRHSMIANADNGAQLVLPGKPPHKPRNARALHQFMSRHGLPTIQARNTAMIEAAAELPPIIISDLFGIHPSTAHAWAQLAQDSWANYLAASQPAAEQRSGS